MYKISDRKSDPTRKTNLPKPQTGAQVPSSSGGEGPEATCEDSLSLLWGIGGDHWAVEGLGGLGPASVNHPCWYMEYIVPPCAFFRT